MDESSTRLCVGRRPRQTRLYEIRSAVVLPCPLLLNHAAKGVHSLGGFDVEIYAATLNASWAFLIESMSTRVPRSPLAHFHAAKSTSLRDAILLFKGSLVAARTTMAALFTY
ncbi:hypothetical protein H310_06047 [Aphanomyces invadans]|uniref:Uncharacterized protein n=1 Tax=Aphanomyces invadans TaxID=157072 RepID=A0A024U9K2_9STRA|nr:hypothetical protein H310_06047 [Aphanomyces invadans]ETW02567.1 hypothetical protein H310_06047 [Aphanomyces invadans]|eukprot:XP_008869172.1 hypothetical protein H310_06047 [Aphanomyces invadans]